MSDLHPALWNPLHLRGVEISNRVMCSATTLQYGEAGRVSDRHQAFYRERAIGGVGLLFTEQLSATPISGSPFPQAILAYDTASIAGFRSLTSALEEYPTRLFAQLVACGGMGSSSVGLDDWRPLRAPGRIPVPGGQVPEPLDRTDIRAICHDFALSARNAVEGGLHGIEVHGAHGWLVGQFLSPFYNQRVDEYGGSVEGRCQFALEIGAAIRAEVGADVPLGLALTYDECIGSAGITLEETKEQLAVFCSSGIYDFFDLSIGAAHSEHMTIATMSVPENFALGAAREAKRVVGKRAAIFVAGRILDIRVAAAAVANGDTDMVAMTRAHLADPHLVRKARENRSDETNRCVGANVCVRRSLEGDGVACVVNPATGRERRWGEGSLTRVAPRRSIVVIGAGPAGLRFAATSARRGHDVLVLEREPEPGGHLQGVAWLPTRASWLHAIEDMSAAVRRHGGQIETEVEATLEHLLGLDASTYVVATGSTWDESGASSLRPDREAIRGAPGDAVYGFGRALALLRQKAGALGKKVVIADETGSYPPLGLAEAVALAGATVHFVTPAGAVGAEAAGDLELPHVLPRLRKLGVCTTVSRHIGSIDRGTVVLEDVWGGEGEVIEHVDSLVFALRRVPDISLFDQLAAQGSDVHVIGDARSPRSTTEVVYEAEDLARSL